MATVIEVTQLNKSFGPVRAVDGLSFSVEKGEVFGLLGPNGAGKTTMIRILNGILPRDGGEVSVLSMDPQIHGDKIRERTGVLTETPALYERLSARENLLFTGRMWGLPEPVTKSRVDEVLSLFDLSDRAEEKVGGFSKGMKQRMALARAILPQPPVLFLDEPTSGLDPESALQVNGLIERFGRSGEKTVFLCTHLLHEAQRLCDRVAVINRGRLLALGSPEELARDLYPGVRVHVKVTRELQEQDQLELRRLEMVEEMTMNNTEMQIKLHQEAQIPDLVAWLVNRNIRICSVVQQEVSLEDVYFTLQKRANGGAA